MALMACKHCATPFQAAPRYRKIFCCRVCWREWGRAHRLVQEKIVCAHCEMVFTPRGVGRKGAKYCSRRCSALAHGFPPAAAAALEARWAVGRSAQGHPLCTQCREELVAGRNIRESRMRRHDYICEPCFREREDLRRRALKAEVFAAYGGRCVCCEETIHDFLTIDHTQGYHNGHTGEPRSGIPLYAWLKRHGFPQESFRLVCFNCNQAVARLGRCPHGILTGPILTPGYAGDAKWR